MLGECILHVSRSSCAHCCCCESSNCLSNSCRNGSQTSRMLSSIGWSLSIHLPMLHAHPKTSFPLMKVRVMATLHIGESNLMTLVLDLKYPNSSFIKWGDLALFPLKILGRAPMVWTSAVGGTGTWVMGVAGLPPGWPPLGCPLPDGPSPPWLPPGGPPFCQSAACRPAYTRSSGVGLLAGGTGAGVRAPWGWEVLVWVVVIVVVCDIVVLGWGMLSVAMLKCWVASGCSMFMFVHVNLTCTGGETLHNDWIVLGGSSTLDSCHIWIQCVT